MNRRQRITLVGGAAGAWPVLARAQQSAIPGIGFLGTPSAHVYAARLMPFRRALKVAGFVEGENIRIEYRWAEERYERLPALPSDRVRSVVASIFVAWWAPGALASKSRASTIHPVSPN